METDQVLEQNAQSQDVPQQSNELPIEDLPDRKYGEKAAEKIHMDGRRVKIVERKLIPIGKISQTKITKKDYEAVTLRLYYDDMDHWENLGGVMRFKRDDGTFGDASVWVDGTNASARLFKMWLRFRNFELEKVSFKDFLMDLKGRTVEIKEEATRNPSTGLPTFKNMVGKFIS